MALTFQIVMAVGLLFVYNHRMSLGPRQLFAIAFVFIIGSIPIIASTVRYATVYAILRDPASAFEKFPDVEAWSEIDCAFATYAACLPALRSLIRKKRDRASGGGSRIGGSAAENGRKSRQGGGGGGGGGEGSAVWLSSRQQGPDNIDDDVDVDAGNWGSGVFTTPICPKSQDTGHSALDIYVSHDFNIAIDRSSQPLPSPPTTARIITGGASPAESYQNFSTAIGFYPQSLRPPPPQHQQQQRQVLDQEDDSASGSDVELKNLGSPPARVGTITPNTLGSER